MCARARAGGDGGGDVDADVATDSAPVDMTTYEICCDVLDVIVDVSCIYGCAPRRAGGGPADARCADARAGDAQHEGARRRHWLRRAVADGREAQQRPRHLFARSQPASAAGVSAVRAADASVRSYLALVCLIRESNFEKHHGLIDFNFNCFKKAIGDVFERKQ